MIDPAGPDPNPDLDPGQNPSPDPNPDPGQNPDPNPGQNPGQNPDRNPGQNPDPDPDPSRDHHQDPDRVPGLPHEIAQDLDRGPDQLRLSRHLQQQRKKECWNLTRINYILLYNYYNPQVSSSRRGGCGLIHLTPTPSLRRYHNGNSDHKKNLDNADAQHFVNCEKKHDPPRNNIYSMDLEF